MSDGYIPLRGEFQDVKTATIIQFYHEGYQSTPPDIKTAYYYSKIGIYTPAQTIIAEIADNYLFKEPIHAAYNAARRGLEAALKEDIDNIVLHTDAVRVMDNIIAEYTDDDYESDICAEAKELHDEVIDLLDEFEIVGFRCLDIGVIKAFEDHVHTNLQMALAINGLSLYSASSAASNTMDID